jgi:hypothetical protein
MNYFTFYGILNISQPYRPPQPVMGITFFMGYIHGDNGKAIPDYLNVHLCNYMSKLKVTRHV